MPLDYEAFQDIINRYKYLDILTSINQRLAQWCDSPDIMKSYSHFLERMEDIWDRKAKENYTLSYEFCFELLTRLVETHIELPKIESSEETIESIQTKIGQVTNEMRKLVKEY